MPKEYNNYGFNPLKFNLSNVIKFLVIMPVLSATHRSASNQQHDLGNQGLDNDERYKSLRGNNGNSNDNDGNLLYQDVSLSSVYDTFSSSDEDAEISFIDLGKNLKDLNSHNHVLSKNSDKKLKSLVKEKKSTREQKTELEDGLKVKDFNVVFGSIKEQLMGYSKELGGETIMVHKVIDWLNQLYSEHNSDIISTQNAKTDLKECQQQTTKAEIYHTLEYVLDTKLSAGIIVDITENKVNVVGRPPVAGGAGKQMQHVTPFSFVKEIIQQTFKDTTDHSIAYSKLQKLIIPFLPKYDMLCWFTTVDKTDPDIEKRLKGNKKINYDKITDNKGDYYLINSSPSIQPKWFVKYMDLYKLKDEQCQEKKLELIEATLDYLKGIINDNNTYNIASEAIAKFILILYNKDSEVAFPTEGNNINKEIRLFKDSRIASGDDFITIKAYEIPSMYNKFTDSIRVVADEGSAIRKVILCIKLLNTCANDAVYDKIFKEISLNLDREVILSDDYMKNCNTPLKLSNEIATSEYFKDIENVKKNTLKHFINEVVKQLYIAFDYKNLEREVFIADNTGAVGINVYEGATVTETTTFKLNSGADYRKNQIWLANGKQKYGTDFNEYRQETIEVEGELTTLANLIFKHIYISARSFEFMTKYSSIGSAILENFIALIKTDYNLNDSQISKVLERVNSLKLDKALFLDVHKIDVEESPLVGVGVNEAPTKIVLSNSYNTKIELKNFEEMTYDKIDLLGIDEY